ncbi:hypothetical protein R1sor_020489 [Riccia sorocarpa]|uniref:CASP-like protein n=1 Tax=Riccia sorocarpa TaxID=122646 RepID=A0ABD3IFQ3_9MARC
MERSHPAVHPVAVPPQFDNQPPPNLRMKDLPGSPGTLGGLALRVGQFGFAIIAFGVMVAMTDFSTVTAFCYLVAAMVLQCLWSISLAMIDLYALLTRRSLRNSLLVGIFVVGDGVTSTLTLAAACATAGITVFIDNDLGECGPSHCAKYEAAAAMAFLSWVLIQLSFLFSFYLLATR